MRPSFMENLNIIWYSTHAPEIYKIFSEFSVMECSKYYEFNVGCRVKEIETENRGIQRCNFEKIDWVYLGSTSIESWWITFGQINQITESG